MTRSTKEWIGATPDSKIPPRVRLRIFERENGRCHLCQQPIQAGERWEANHDPALINGGENRESRIFPAHVKCHKGHTRAATAEKSKVAQTRQKHLGIKTVKRPLKSRNSFGLSEHKAKRREKSALPPKPMFAPAGEIIKEGRKA